ncbi:hypothetical protein NDU88_005498 [Pleurodeles waltl]|uniref:Uncharacterized protein n=1 Tax=Pleurodeles waltl TaxID=8319 RepID=A0AAV7L1E1_PLEWA|nr:hypothetical protein NDU88_005498 [Pleurodeles waltl]
MGSKRSLNSFTPAGLAGKFLFFWRFPALYSASASAQSCMVLTEFPLCLPSYVPGRRVGKLRHNIFKMTEWMSFEEEEYGQGYEEALGPQLGEGLSEVINASVQQSLNRATAISVPQKNNQAVMAALKPLTQQLECFVKKQGLVPLPQDKLTEDGPSVLYKPKTQAPSWPHDGAIPALTQSSASDHVYCSLPSSSKDFPLEAEHSSVSDSAASESSHSSGSIRKRKRAKRAKKSSSSQAKGSSRSQSISV